MIFHEDRSNLMENRLYKELIIGAGGENIAPVPMEDEIKKNAPAISNCMMVPAVQLRARCLHTCMISSHVGPS